MTPRRRDERGVAFPSPLVILSVVAVAMAGIAFVATQGADERERELTTVSQPEVTPEVAPAPEAEPKKKKRKKKKPAVRRGDVLVEVYNNSGITGLAQKTSTTADEVGWQVVGSDNWYGTIPGSTVYYPPRLEEAARMLARDLGISRVQPAVDPMRLDRLTVILTADQS
ncbi:LytR C-terminal domain-containing protein [Nocardioides sp.]|uniref:LytR C-terminal domain-containing protein n=1 Tax=Nocardioides sp. TaxID=35761 RepID=UPI0027349A26|nr:LytR C-terminal domain-containing protein [Nocardioides sp.]MDP3891877.1 LytR C-terminal domain-containing protein [Nocardioides sp.]